MTERHDNKKINEQNRRLAGLYVHIPFCEKKCAYCDFYSLEAPQWTDAYLTALETEAFLTAQRHPGLLFDSVYIGGGTPSLLTPAQLDRLFDILTRHFSCLPGSEVTLEANPATLDCEKLSLLRERGVNRLSLGLQSASDRELKLLSRLHDYRSFLQTYRLASAYFQNISVDLMFGLPCQTRESFSETLSEVLALAPAHLSLYALKLEKGTPLSKNRELFSFPDEDAFADIYLSACERLEDAGYRQYEISNFARQGFFSRHNLRYWKREEYLGLGPSAHSFIDGCRYANKRDLSGYCRSLSEGRFPERSEMTRLSPGDILEEEIFLFLRLAEGLDLPHLEEKTGYAMEKASCAKLLFYEKEGYMRLERGRTMSYDADARADPASLPPRCPEARERIERIALTPKGFLVSNAILADLLP